ncbi:hypothetical protein AX17_006962 [Amanita inopinata Kibby_2008]|nr:hypothetical protein AX17_006962 [Amanita inopinata Kibby_2008]
MQSSPSKPNARRSVLDKFFRVDKSKKAHALTHQSGVGDSGQADPTVPSPVATNADIPQLVGDFMNLMKRHEPLEIPSGSRQVGFPEMKAILQGFASLPDGPSGVPSLGSALQIGLKIVQTAEASIYLLCF